MDILKSIGVWLVGITFLIVFFPITFIVWLFVLPFDRERSIVHWMLIYQAVIISYMVPIWKITVNRGDKESKEKMMEESYQCLMRGISIMIFPEGTRSSDREIAFFKRGAFQLAIYADRPILPVLMDGTGGVLPKHGLIFGGFHKIVIRVLDPVMPESFGTQNPEELAIRFQQMMMEALKDLRNETG